jgi:hypothetical protein
MEIEVLSRDSRVAIRIPDYGTALRYTQSADLFCSQPRMFNGTTPLVAWSSGGRSGDMKPLNSESRMCAIAPSLSRDGAIRGCGQRKWALVMTSCIEAISLAARPMAMLTSAYFCPHALSKSASVDHAL